MSSQIWCYLKFERWRKRWRDGEMKKKLVQTYIKPSLVLSQIWEMKSEMKKWKQKKIVQTYVKPNLVLSQIWEMKIRCRDEKHFLVKSGVISNLRDEEMKKKVFGPNICQAKSGVISDLRDEMKKKIQSKNRDEKKIMGIIFFWVWTYVKPNLVLSQIPFTTGGMGGRG